MTLYDCPRRLEPRRQEESPAHRIPRTIHQTFASRKLPARMYRALSTWIDLNPEFSYRFSDDEDCRQLIRSEFDLEVLRAYEALPKGAFRADLWRYCALFQYGGVYADLDTICLSPLRLLIQETDEFIVPRAVANPHSLFNAFLCATPRHPFMASAIERAVDLTRAGDTRSGFEIVGPTGLGASVNKVLGRPSDAAFVLGRQELNRFSFRLLNRTWGRDFGNRLVFDGPRPVLQAKYHGYFEDLDVAGVAHWRKAWPRKSQ